MTKGKVIFSTVLALFVLAAIFLPMIGSGPMSWENQPPDRIHLEEIARGYLTYTKDGTRPRSLRVPPGSTAHQAAFLLAKYTGLNNATRYFTDKDPLRPSPLPQVVIQGDLRDAAAPDLEFANATLSVVIAANLPIDAPPTSTPIAWTRGLQPDGTWSSNSPREGAGGHVAFLDGHVQWFDKMNALDPTSSFVVYPGRPNAGANTANVLEALPPDAVILSAEPRSTAK